MAAAIEESTLILLRNIMLFYNQKCSNYPPGEGQNGDIGTGHAHGPPPPVGGVDNPVYNPDPGYPLSTFNPPPPSTWEPSTGVESQGTTYPLNPDSVPTGPVGSGVPGVNPSQPQVTGPPFDGSGGSAPYPPVSGASTGNPSAPPPPYPGL